MVREMGASKNKKPIKNKDPGKIQSREMERAIERSKDISAAYLHGGKAIGEIVRSKKKIKKK